MDRVVVILLCLHVAVVFLHAIETVASERWYIDSLNGAVGGGRSNFRVLHAWAGAFEHAVAEPIRRLNNPTGWSCVRALGRTVGLATSAFAMIHTVECGLEHMAFVKMRGFPWRLWSLLEKPFVETAQGILDTATCLRDPFTDMFLDYFKTTAALLGRHCSATLVALGLIVRYEITLTECRNAQLRRFCKAGETWAAYLAVLSAQFVLQLHRTLEHKFKYVVESVAAKHHQGKQRMHNSKKQDLGEQAVGGGGAQRAFMAKFLAR